MHGFECHAAGHMIFEGLVQEGMAVTRSIHDRYHASKRNPWNEIECGEHYARSMASYGVYLAACGFEYHGPRFIRRTKMARLTHANGSHIRNSTMLFASRIHGVLAFAIALCIASVCTAADDRADPGFQSIFDGKSLDGWDGDPNLWRVEDGTVVGETTAEKPARGNTFLIWRGGKPGDFELKAEFRMPNEGFANSGIQVRSWEGPNQWQVFGYQPDMDAGNAYTGIIYGENFRGILAGRGQKVVIGEDHKRQVVKQFADSGELAKVIKPHDWNESHIIAQGDTIIHKINGHLMAELTDNDTVARRDGVIALQLHAGPPMKVQFRNIRLKLLNDKKRGE